MMKTSDNKRVARNTIFLYIRMLFVMGIQLFSFRLLLEYLGVVDYGTYNVVAGVVILFSFLSTALTTSTQRYLAYGIGKGDKDWFRLTFITCVNVQILMAIAIFLLSETIGLWFLNNKMNFDGISMTKVNWVYQLSILTFIIHLIQVPYSATIIAHEKMNIYALLGIIDIILKFGAVIILIFFSTLRLVIYPMALVIVALIIFFIYKHIVEGKFPICKYKLYWDSKMMKEVTKFSFWNMLGGIGNVGAGQGINVLFNIFCGVSVNAAQGIANQVTNAVSSFFNNFQTAFNPQIIKTYAAGEIDIFLSNLLRVSRLSFLLAYIIGFPVIVCAKTILDIWLTDVPQYSITFVQLSIIFCIIDALSGPLWVAAQASGDIKKYMLIVSTMIFSNVPAAYIILRLGFSPVYVIGYKASMNFCIHIFRVFYMRRLFPFPIAKYFKSVMLRAILVVSMSIPLPTLWNNTFGYNLFNQVILLIMCFIYVSALSWFILITKKERMHLIKIGLSKISHK